eukprot:2647858-Rhodomonas_salina.4
MLFNVFVRQTVSPVEGPLSHTFPEEEPFTDAVGILTLCYVVAAGVPYSLFVSGPLDSVANVLENDSDNTYETDTLGNNFSTHYFNQQFETHYRVDLYKDDCSPDVNVSQEYELAKQTEFKFILSSDE